MITLNSTDTFDYFAAGNLAERERYHEVHEGPESAKECKFSQNNPPVFKGVSAVTERLLGAFASAGVILSFWHVFLRTLRVLVLVQGLTLVMPSIAGPDVLNIPRSALFDANGDKMRESLEITLHPQGTTVYTRQVSLVFTGCVGFQVNDRRWHLFDNDRGACLQEEWREGRPNRFLLPPTTPVVAIAADKQEIEVWPSSPRSYPRADYVETPPRILRLGIANKNNTLHYSKFQKRGS